MPEFLIGALLLAPFAIWETVQRGPMHPEPGAWGAFAYLLTACTLVAYPVWFRLLEVADASEVTVFIFLQPVVGAIMSVYLFHDPFTAVTALGAALVFGGVAGITYRKKPRVSGSVKNGPAARNWPLGSGE